MRVAVAQLSQSQGQGMNPSWDLIWEQSPAQLTPPVLGWVEIPAPGLPLWAGIPLGSFQSGMATLLVKSRSSGAWPGFPASAEVRPSLERAGSSTEMSHGWKSVASKAELFPGVSIVTKGEQTEPAALF